MEKAMGAMTSEEARVAIGALLMGEVTSIAPHPDGGWEVAAEHMAKSAVDLIDEHEEFHYCHVETIHEDDAAFYRETVMQTPPENGAEPRAILEGVYQREIRADGRNNASFEGRIAYLGEGTGEEALDASFKKTFAERTFREYVNNMGYLRDGLRTVSHYLQAGYGGEEMTIAMRTLGEINRMVIDMDARHAA